MYPQNEKIIWKNDNKLSSLTINGHFSKKCIPFLFGYNTVICYPAIRLKRGRGAMTKLQ